DVNMDGEVNVNDVTTLINYILGKNPTPFDSVAADVNEDTAINVNDVTALINLILN
ncbi:MAG: dockerin type I repeat-containing protein, partial [Muribaculaceae bacterium]|nr:dockerin type I repeat-containing protein [Muribaculaceae bacterium]